jgi:hypothetical protein
MKAIKIPFSFSNGGVSETSDIIKITEQKIVDTLVTRSGERAIKAGYGVGIQSLLYELTNDLIFDDFKQDAKDAINQELESGKVLDISISFQDSAEMAFVEDTPILVNVYYTLPYYGARSFSVNLTSDI